MSERAPIFRAAFDNFAGGGGASTGIDPEHNGKPLTKTAQTRLAGNSVCPVLSQAIVAANVRQEQERAA